MGRKIGIIAGSGEFPFLVLKEARKQGYSPVVAGIYGEAESSLKGKAETFEWIDVGGLEHLLSYFRDNNVKEAVFAGKVDPRSIYRKEKFDTISLRVLDRIQERTPEAVIKAIIDFMAEEGIQILDPSVFIPFSYCEAGILTETGLSPAVEEDVAFGWRIARSIADLDVGQTVIVKDKTVVAVEGIEGTDEAIKRGGRLAGEGTVVVKVSRTSQDPRVDLPAVGLNTVESLVQARSRALCLEAQKIPFFQRKEAVSLADANKISIVAKKS
jgi:DUF1009 family protein